MTDILLIAGLGPAHLSFNDRAGSCFSPEFDKPEIYEIDGYSYLPTNLIYSNDNNSKPLLVPRTEADLISNYLLTVFNKAQIPCDFISTRKIWDGEKLSKQKYRIICLSTTFMWSEYIFSYAINWIKDNFEFDYLILGGQYASMKQNHILNTLDAVSFISFGDANVSLIPLIRDLTSSNSDNLQEIPCISWKENGEIKRTHYLEPDINSDFLVDFKQYYDMIPYIAMIGCPYHCAFCAQSNCNPTWQYRSAENIAKDWKELKKQGYRHIDIHDSTFFIPFSKIEEFIPLISDLGLTWSANCRSDTPLNEDICSKLEKSGCIDLYFGFESMSDNVLGYMQKKTTVQQNRYINKLFSNSRVNTTMSFMVGFPGETREDFFKTRNYLLNEHVGFFTSTIFEFEDELMPIWQEREKYNLQIFDTDSEDFRWQHGGINWSHCGMNSDEARELRLSLIRDVRNNDNSLAVYRSWQYRYLFPIISNHNKIETMRIEKLLDRLVYLSYDYPNEEERKTALKNIADELNSFGIFGVKI